jgi:ATP-binding cassette subfamily B (MDR/TAP) protein 1
MAVILCIMFGAVGMGQFAADASDKAVAAKAAESIQRLWSLQSKINGLSEQGLTLDKVQGEIRFQSCSFSYPQRPEHVVYDKINMTFESGKTVALVGPSGCGKSTAVALVERFYDVDDDGGCVTLDGVDIRTLRVSWLRAQIGLVSQEPVLFSGSIMENILFGKMGATREDVEAAAKMANAHDFISEFPSGYDTQVGEKGVQLSGGQKQRVAIARAIIRDPSILILDEATSALDSASERVVQEALDRLVTQKRRTTIVIAHRLSTIRNADKIIVLNQGAVVEEGTHDQLMQNGSGHHYRDLLKSGK